MATNRRDYGWCDNPRHDRTDHPRSPFCENFVSDDEHTARLLAEAREHDARATASTWADGVFSEDKPFPEVHQ